MRWLVVLGAVLVTACAMPVTQATETATGAVPTTQRFFVTGSDGRFVIHPRGAKERTTIQYRRADGTYDEDALARLRRVLRSRDGGERTPPWRLVEILGRVWELGGRRTLVLNSGYRSPTYNEGLRNRGRKAAGGSMHTEAMAADVAIPGANLQTLWLALRELECCGVGFYGRDGFLHIDVGQPRFWESTTSGVEKNLSAGNARLFARTDWDRYAPRAAIAVTLHALTAPPVGIATAATMVFDDGERIAVTVRGDGGGKTDCMAISERDAVLHAAAPARAGRGRLELRTCPPQPESTPAEVWSNPVEVVGKASSK